MSRAQHLPLYSSTYSYLREIYRLRVKLPKVLKYDLGQEIFSSALKLIKCIVAANRIEKKELKTKKEEFELPREELPKPCSRALFNICQ